MWGSALKCCQYYTVIMQYRVKSAHVEFIENNTFEYTEFNL